MDRHVGATDTERGEREVRRVALDVGDELQYCGLVLLARARLRVVLHDLLHGLLESAAAGDDHRVGILLGHVRLVGEL